MFVWVLCFWTYSYENEKLRFRLFIINKNGVCNIYDKGDLSRGWNGVNKIATGHKIIFFSIGNPNEATNWHKFICWTSGISNNFKLIRHITNSD